VYREIITVIIINSVDVSGDAYHQFSNQ